MSQIVDTETAKEFMKETLEKIEEGELVKISGELEVKSGHFREKLSEGRMPRLSGEELYDVLRLVFATRRKAKKILEEFESQGLSSWITELLYGKSPVHLRFQDFCSRLGSLDPHIRYDLAGELLHFTFPDRYWLWSHWMWNPKTETGSLPLVTTEDFGLHAPSLGESYLKVGKAIAFVHEVGDAAGFQSISRSLFGTDVYLSCVYIVYAYTILRMRMTQEFNKVMPGLPEFSRRLLGVYNM
ncbi:MAG: hypothetical protein KDD06_20625 [Phaeodactylibacter sp.]|nr:hypothetical protein [Phaeodactylibacter sp.]MCB9265840.1 hypothetical protein [Lewinellaceae bacterium]MCB9288822.1 hypothetical protein [Lewinellaceae bacterium]